MNAILNAAPIHFMELWEQLLDAQHGSNSYGGDTAEIYVSTFMRHSSTVVLDHMRGGEVSDGYREDYREAAATLHALCRLFESRRGVVLEMQEGPLDDLLGPGVFDHRVHLTVVGSGSERQWMNECCYLDEDNDIFIRQPDENRYVHYLRDTFPDHAAAAAYLGTKPGTDPTWVATLCRIAFDETTLEDEGLCRSDVYRTSEDLEGGGSSTVSTSAVGSERGSTGHGETTGGPVTQRTNDRSPAEWADALVSGGTYSARTFRLNDEEVPTPPSFRPMRLYVDHHGGRAVSVSPMDFDWAEADPREESSVRNGVLSLVAEDYQLDIEIASILARRGDE